MASISTYWRALMAAANTYRLALSPYDAAARSTAENYSIRLAQYRILEDAFDGVIFYCLENGRNRYSEHLSSNKLYVYTRPIFNLTPDQVNFYTYRVYPGALSSDGSSSQNGLESAIPLMGASDELRAAIVQAWQWSQWQRGVLRFVSNGAKVGDTFARVIDDVDGGQVRAQVINPRYVKEVEFGESLHINYLVWEYPAFDRDGSVTGEKGKAYTFRAILDKEMFQTFKDDEPFDYSPDKSRGIAWANEYGFVPWVYAPHEDPGTDSLPGRPALQSLQTLEQLNSLASRTTDYIHREAKSPILGVAWEDISVENTSVDPEQLLILRTANPDARTEPLHGSLEIAPSQEQIRMMYTELKERNPEATAWQRMREMGDISGVALRRLSGDIEGRLRGAQANYDAASISLFRQMVAIGGMRYKEGKDGWANKTEQRSFFAPFDINSYQRGDLDFSIGPRELMPDSDVEKSQARLQEFTAQQAELATIAQAEQAGLLEWQLQQQGKTDEEIKDFMAMRAQGRSMAFDARNSDLQPVVER